MRYKRWFLLLLALLAGCGYLFYAAYAEVKGKAIEQLNLQQRIHARQAARGIESLFSYYTSLLNDLSRNTQIISLDDRGRHVMDLFQKAYSDINAITRVDANGRLLYTVPFNPKLIGSDLTGQEHVREILKSHQPVVSDVFTSVQGIRTVAYHVPVFEGAAFRGTVAVLIPFEMIARRFLEEIRVGETGYAWMISQNGVELYCPAPGHVGRKTSETCRPFPSVSAMADRMMEGREGVATYDHDHIREPGAEPAVNHAFYLPVWVGNTFWSIAVATSEKEALAVMKGFRDRWFILIAILIGVCPVVSYLILKAWVVLKEENRRKAAEQALRLGEERLRLVLAGSNHGFWDWSIRSDLLDINPRFAEIMGLDPGTARIPLITWEEAVHPDDLSSVKKALQDHLEGRCPQYEAEYRIASRSGEWKWVLDRAKLVEFDEQRTPLRMAGTVTDVTERRRLEEELLRMKKIESVSVLAGGIAHDFNNILTSILGNISLARLMAKEGDRAKAEEILAEAEKASLRARGLTQQLLTFSRGGAPVKKTESLAEIMRESTEFVLRGARARCEFSIPSDLWPVEIDEGQISQVVQNLIINADQSMPEGGTIRLGAENLEIQSQTVLPLPTGFYVKVAVTDQGIGIPPEHLAKVFDPYFTTKQKGSGLGLATSYSIIRNHHGHIEVESRPGTGTTFTFYLPKSAKEIRGTSPEEAGTSKGGKGRVLVMDDDGMILKFVVRVLATYGYAAETVSDGAEAISVYRKAKDEGKPFDAVIMDLTIPGGMGGREAVEKLREIDPGVKAIVSSGYANDPVMAEYEKYGFKAVIAKPYQIRVLGQVLRKVIDGPEEKPSG